MNEDMLMASYDNGETWVEVDELSDIAYPEGTIFKWVKRNAEDAAGGDREIG